jgi:hypothetical protein
VYAEQFAVGCPYVKGIYFPNAVELSRILCTFGGMCSNDVYLHDDTHNIARAHGLTSTTTKRPCSHPVILKLNHAQTSTTLAGPSFTNMSWYLSEVATQFERLWASDGHFSEVRLNQVRSSVTEQKAGAVSKSWLIRYIESDNKRLANSPPDIDIAPHPIFNKSNFVTNLLLDEVEEQLKPVATSHDVP